jgi:hypothetical protein
MATDTQQVAQNSSAVAPNQAIGSTGASGGTAGSNTAGGACQAETEAQKSLFSQVNEVLAVKPKRTIDEQVARFEKIVAQERTQARTQEKSKARRRPDQIMDAPHKP